MTNELKTVYLLVGGDRGITIDEIHGVYDSKEMAETQYDILDQTITLPNYELWITEETMNPEYEDIRKNKRNKQ